MRLILLPLIAAVAATGLGAATPKKLEPGEFEWQPDLSPSGPLLLVCSLDDQMAYVFRNGVQIARSTGIFGTPSNPAPTGVFSIHPQRPEPPRDADLPMLRQLEWTGLSIPAAGPAPAPAPFSALHLPPRFSEKLHPILKEGATLAITRKGEAPSQSSAPASVMLETSSPEPDNRAIPKGRPIWEPEKAPKGPVSIFLSYPDRTVYIWRAGVQIGQCPVALNTTPEKLPDGLFLMLDGDGKPDPAQPEIKLHPWSVLSLTGATVKGDIVTHMRESFTLDPEFRVALDSVLQPGTLLFASHYSSNQNYGSGTLSLGSIDDLPDPE